MRFQIETILRVTPDVFWGRLFFDRDYLDGLYRALGFESYEIRSLETDAHGKVERQLRAVPQFHAPAIVQRKLAGRLFYDEHGTFDPGLGVWTFRTIPSVASEHAHIVGKIHLAAHPRGLRHMFELEARVSAFGLGALIERAVEKNTRDSFRKTAEFTDEYAARQGFLAS